MTVSSSDERVRKSESMESIVARFELKTELALGEGEPSLRIGKLPGDESSEMAPTDGTARSESSAAFLVAGKLKTPLDTREFGRGEKSISETRRLFEFESDKSIVVCVVDVLAVPRAG